LNNLLAKLPRGYSKFAAAIAKHSGLEIIASHRLTRKLEQLLFKAVDQDLDWLPNTHSKWLSLGHRVLLLLGVSKVFPKFELFQK
jgi:hypothetical protein